MPLDLKREIGNHRIIVLVIPNDTYTECVSAFGESLPDFVLLNIKEEHALLLKTNFQIPSTEELEGNFVLLLTAKSIEKILDAIKEKL